MIYTGNFADINNVQCSVDIFTEAEPQEVLEVKMGDEPIITTIESEEENMFKPVKYSSATIKLVTHKLLLDIYSSKAQGTRIIFKRNNEVMWTGYITPNLYNQDYNYDLENLELECIDGLSTLQYFDYESLGPTSEYGPGRKFRSFAEILISLIKKCNCYKYVYFTKSLQEDQTKKENIFDFLKVTEMNFFDEDDEPMKCNEVLEEICKFAGVTCIAEGESVYFLNYESLENFNHDEISNKYQKVNLSDNTSTEVTIGDIKPIEGNFRENSTQVSLGPTYNKIKVIDSLYSVDKVFSDLDDNKLLVNKNAKNWSEYRKIAWVPNKIYYDSYFKFYDHPNFECFHYDLDGVEIPNADVKTYDDLDNYLGGNIMKVFAHREDKETQGEIIPSLDYKTYIYVDNQHHRWNPGLPWYPAVRTKINHEVALNDKYAYLVLDGSVIFNTKNLHIPITEDAVKSGFKEEDLYIECVLRYGDKVYDDTIEGPFGKGGWINTDYDKGSTFKIYLECDGLTDLLFNKSFSFKSNIDYTMGLDTTSGYAIKLPIDYYTTEAPVLLILQPRHRITQKGDVEPAGKNAETGFWLGDFNCDIKLSYNQSDEDDIETDTKYENTIDEAYVNDFDDEEFKVCTWDGKQANYSAVLYDNTVVPPGPPYYFNTNGRYVDKIYNTKDYARSEELFIKRMIRQYSKPPIVIDAVTNNNLHCYTLLITDMLGEEKEGIPHKRFIVDSYEINWRYNTNKVKLNQIKL